MKIIGINSGLHDSSACLVIDGHLISFGMEERFTRKKHDNSYPINSIKHCLNSSNLDFSDIDCVANSWNYFDYELEKLKWHIDKVLEISESSNKRAINYLKELMKRKRTYYYKFNQAKTQTKKYFKCDFRNVDHHLAHAYSSFPLSGFETAAVLIIDGSGEKMSISMWHFKDQKNKLLKSYDLPHSLGIFYGAITQYLGFIQHDEEWKVMGWAPYGKPKFYELLKQIINPRTIKMDLKYFQAQDGKFPWYTEHLTNLFKINPRKPEHPYDQAYADIAASAQLILENSILNLVKEIKELTGEDNLCMAGGVALNCKANGEILNSQIFDSLYIPPASADDGAAIGAALKIAKGNGLNIFNNFPTIYLGSSYNTDDYKSAITKHKLQPKKFIEKDLYAYVANKLKSGLVVGWFQGASEMGPRALGNRSIIANPNIANMKAIINKKIKFREPFRPFAPSVLEKNALDYFEGNLDNAEYMNKTFKIKEDKKNKIPAVVHVDSTSRIQIVKPEKNKRFYNLIKAFYDASNIPMVLNTSFNIKGEPIVDSPEDAINCYVKTDMDMLILGNYIIEKNPID